MSVDLKSVASIFTEILLVHLTNGVNVVTDQSLTQLSLCEEDKVITRGLRERES